MSFVADSRVSNTQAKVQKGNLLADEKCIIWNLDGVVPIRISCVISAAEPESDKGDHGKGPESSYCHESCLLSRRQPLQEVVQNDMGRRVG